MPILDLTNVNVSVSFQRLMQIDQSGNQYDGLGNLINRLIIQSTVYPSLSFSTIDYSSIPNNAYLIGFDLDSGNKLTKIDNSGLVTVIEGVGGGGTIASVSDTNTIDLAIISGDLSAVVKYQDTADILLSSDSFGLTAAFATKDISQFTNDSAYIKLSDLSQGTGISYDSMTGVITNSLPDQTVVLSNGTGISISGTYPSFTITNSSPDQTVVLTQGGTTTITGTYPNFTISSADQYTGTVTSVGLSMPSAFSVANSPVTSSNTLTVTGAGTVSQYIRGDGSLANFPISIGGGSSVSYYLNGGTSQGTFGGNIYYEISRTPVIGAMADFTIAADGYIAQFITDAGDPNLLNIPAGTWNLSFYFSASAAGNAPSFYVELYKYDGASFTLIASNSSNPEYITNGTAIDLYSTSLAVTSTSLSLTDRLAIKVYVNYDSRTITLHTQDVHLSQIATTFSTGVTALNGLTDQVQSFTTGTTGSDFNISSATSIHTFNLPVAGATNSGKLSSADWSTFNNKVTSISSGTGISVGGTTTVPIITNTAPDQIVALTPGAGIAVTGTYPNFTIASSTSEMITVLIDATPDDISLGKKAQRLIPYNCSVSEWYIISEQTGSIEFDLKKSTFSGYPTTSSIISVDPPKLVNQSKNSDLSVTGWTNINAGDILEIYVSSNVSIKYVTLYLKLQKI